MQFMFDEPKLLLVVVVLSLLLVPDGSTMNTTANLSEQAKMFCKNLTTTQPIQSAALLNQTAWFIINDRVFQMPLSSLSKQTWDLKAINAMQGDWKSLWNDVGDHFSDAKLIQMAVFANSSLSDDDPDRYEGHLFFSKSNNLQSIIVSINEKKMKELYYDPKANVYGLLSDAEGRRRLLIKRIDQPKEMVVFVPLAPSINPSNAFSSKQDYFGASLLSNPNKIRFHERPDKSSSLPDTPLMYHLSLPTFGFIVGDKVHLLDQTSKQVFIFDYPDKEKKEVDVTTLKFEQYFGCVSKTNDTSGNNNLISTLLVLLGICLLVLAILGWYCYRAGHRMSKRKSKTKSVSKSKMKQTNKSASSKTSSDSTVQSKSKIKIKSKSKSPSPATSKRSKSKLPAATLTTTASTKPKSTSTASSSTTGVPAKAPTSNLSTVVSATPSDMVHASSVAEICPTTYNSNLAFSVTGGSTTGSKLDHSPASDIAKPMKGGSMLETSNSSTLTKTPQESTGFMINSRFTSNTSII